MGRQWTQVCETWDVKAKEEVGDCGLAILVPFLHQVHLVRMGHVQAREAEAVDSLHPVQSSHGPREVTW